MELWKYEREVIDMGMRR